MTEEEYRKQKRRRSRHEYYMKARESALAYQKEYDKRHREQKRAYMKEYRSAHRKTKTPEEKFEE